MNKKRNNFFEEHVEKIVLAIAGLVFLWFFIARVLFSPVCIEYDNNKFSPDEIDSYIEDQTVVLENKLDRDAEPKEQPYEPKVDDFIALLDSSINNIDASVFPPQPIIIPPGRVDDRIYRVPSIGEVTDVEVEHIRAVAYVPKVEIGDKNVYSSSNSEPNDIDFVTVEAKFDAAELYDNFNNSFASERIKEAWRDPCLARPIFAAVELQRQELLPDGSWSDWQVVPRSKIEPYRGVLDIIEDINDLPAGGMKVRLLQYNNIEIKADLLQPPAYQIASAREEWFPPSLHKKFVEYQKEMERLEAAAERREEREDDRPNRRREIRTPVTSAIGEGGGGAPSAGRGTSSARRTPARSRTERQDSRDPMQTKYTPEDIDKEYKDVMLTSIADLSRSESLLFWAHDDTVKPGMSYRYKIRLGVFNPIAGTNQFHKQDESMKNKVILWSKASDVTEVVNIPGTLYFFPREIQETAKAVTVQVSRYILGYWYSKDFTVKQGELVGKVSEYKITEEEEKKRVTVPSEVDYATGAVLVDIIPVNDWAGGSNLHARHFFDMLYSFDGKSIERLPVKTRYWTDDLQNKFNEIRKLEKEPKEPLKTWTGRLGIRQRPKGTEGTPSTQMIGE